MLQGESGYVKDYRSTLSWEWFTDVNTAHLWEYIRLRVNYEPSRFRGMEIRRGEMLESIPRIALNTGLTVQKVRTALEHLKSTGEITCKSTRYGMLICAVKYAFFQDQGSADNTEVTRDTTLKQHGSNTEVTTYKENKNIRNKENKREAVKPPTLSEIESYISEINGRTDPNRFFEYYQARDWKGITDWKAAIRSWEASEKDRRKSGAGKREDILPAYMTEHKRRSRE